LGAGQIYTSSKESLVCFFELSHCLLDHFEALPPIFWEVGLLMDTSFITSRAVQLWHLDLSVIVFESEVCDQFLIS